MKAFAMSETLGTVTLEERMEPARQTDPVATLLAIQRIVSTDDLLRAEAIDVVRLELRRWEASRQRPPAAAPARGLARWQVKRVSAYMQENLDEDIDLQDLADLVGLSRFYFCSAFRIATGYTPHEWLTRVRIAEARRLLALPSMLITEIALAVGYQTPSAFAAVFRRTTGVSPREFRRNL